MFIIQEYFCSVILREFRVQNIWKRKISFFTINLITWPQCGECPTHHKVTAYETREADQMVQIMQECHALSVHTPKITQTDVSWM